MGVLLSDEAFWNYFCIPLGLSGCFRISFWTCFRVFWTVLWVSVFNWFSEFYSDGADQKHDFSNSCWFSSFFWKGSCDFHPWDTSEKKFWKSGEFKNPQNSSEYSKACSEKNSETTRVVQRYSEIFLKVPIINLELTTGYRSERSHEIIQFEATFRDFLIPSSSRKSKIYLQHKFKKHIHTVIRGVFTQNLCKSHRKFYCYGVFKGYPKL